MRYPRAMKLLLVGVFIAAAGSVFAQAQSASRRPISRGPATTAKPTRSALCRTTWCSCGWSVRLRPLHQ